MKCFVKLLLLHYPTTLDTWLLYNWTSSPVEDQPTDHRSTATAASSTTVPSSLWQTVGDAHSPPSPHPTLGGLTVWKAIGDGGLSEPLVHVRFLFQWAVRSKQPPAAESWLLRVVERRGLLVSIRTQTSSFLLLRPERQRELCTSCNWTWFAWWQTITISTTSISSSSKVGARWVLFLCHFTGLRLALWQSERLTWGMRIVWALLPMESTHAADGRTDERMDGRDYGRANVRLRTTAKVKLLRW